MCGVLCLSVSGVEASKAQRQVTVTVHRIAEIDDLDTNFLGIGDKPDFYAEIWIDGNYHKTENFSHSDGRPMWTFTAPATGNVADIRIRLWDDDGGLEGKDDHIDINPARGEKDLMIRFDTASGTLLNNTYGVVGSEYLYTQGGGEKGKAQLWFTVK
jgi:hypothetical protein